MFQKQTNEVRAWYRRFDLIPEKFNKEPDDHIGLEMLFTAHLSRLGVNALEKHDKTSFEELIKAQKGFLSEHLMRWGLMWCNLVIENATTDFYRGIALISRGALYELSSLFELKLPSKASE
jgi:TorA maturation chaperone TorD